MGEDKMTLNRIVCAIGFVVVTSSAYAQGDQCKDILSQGIWDKSETTSAEATDQSFMDWFCTKSFSSETEAKSFAGSVSVPIGEVPVDFFGEYDSSKWNQYYSEACRKSEGKYKHSASFRSFKQKANAAIVGAWSKCMERQGLNTWLETTANPNKIRFQARYVPVADTIPKAKFGLNLEDEKGPMACSAPLIGKSPFSEILVGGSPFSVECTRNAGAECLAITATIVNANINGVAAPSMEMKRCPPPPPPPPCVREFGSKDNRINLTIENETKTQSCDFTANVKKVDVKVEGETALLESTVSEKLGYTFSFGGDSRNEGPYANSSGATVAKIKETYTNISVPNPEDFKVGVKATTCAGPNDRSSTRTCTLWVKFTVTPK